MVEVGGPIGQHDRLLNASLSCLCSLARLPITVTALMLLTGAAPVPVHAVGAADEEPLRVPPGARANEVC